MRRRSRRRLASCSRGTAVSRSSSVRSHATRRSRSRRRSRLGSTMTRHASSLGSARDRRSGSRRSHTRPEPRSTPAGSSPPGCRSEERRVGKECRSLWLPHHYSRGRNTSSLCDWSSDVCSSDLELGPLTRDEAVALAKALAPRIDDDEARELARKCEGSPFWLEALAYTAGAEVDAGRLVTARLQIGRAAGRERV